MTKITIITVLSIFCGSMSNCIGQNDNQLVVFDINEYKAKSKAKVLTAELIEVKINKVDESRYIWKGKNDNIFECLTDVNIIKVEIDQVNINYCLGCISQNKITHLGLCISKEEFDKIE
jgi:hypothetical protein